jgi:selenium metabolism protein YedF
MEKNVKHMKEKIIDATNLPCPRPLIMTKKGLSEAAPDEQIVILINNETSKENVERFLRDNGIDVEIRKENDLYKIYAAGRFKAQSPEPQGSTTICLSANFMGRGDEELGKLLMQGFVNTIKEFTPLPKNIICYNSGVKLAADDSPIRAGLKDLQDKGVDIIVCGTCADFFRLKERISVGRISNMYEILEKLSQAGKVINP